MGAEPQKLHVAFFPFMAAGHMIPTLDMAKLFASQHVKTTIITTPMNAPVFTKPLQTYNNPGPPIDIEIIPFPSKEVGLPEGVESSDQVISCNDMSLKFLKATQMFQEPLKQFIEKCMPNCLVVDMLLPYAMDVPAKFNIPTLVFGGGNCFAQCVYQTMLKYPPHKSIKSNDEEFVIPNLPHVIKLTKNKLPAMMRGEVLDETTREWMKLFGYSLEAENKSYGVIFNTFYELEPDYVEYYRNVVGRKVWHIGPLSLCNGENEAKLQRGKDSSIDEHECLKWLDSKKAKSVVYICFGSMAQVSNTQLHDIAMGLEASEQNFIWVVKNNAKDEEWLPRGYEKRMEGKGLIIRGWAPQVLILEHEAIGAFVSHCGWNSLLEGISCGVPLVTWPVFADQFHNEILVNEVLKMGVGVGDTKWSQIVEGIAKENIETAIRRVMVGEEAFEIGNRAKEIKEMARKAVEVGGSSYCDLSSFIQELGS